MLKKRKSFIRNEKGMAIFEMIPILVIIVLFVNFSLGFFGAIHTGILNSIASRNYAFETFRNRSNLTYFRNIGADVIEYSQVGMRVHGTVSESSKGGDNWVASSRTIDFMNFQPKRAADIVGNSKNVHSTVRGIPEGRNETIGVNPIWIKTTYGICLNAKCGT
ncbi:hypothetical protein QJS83_08465 [Bdellovibrio sp. 22V]|uniref:hypothetical protein n=1 Tax=Bdellovibrio TaxID=958 RepID=UPI002542FAA0|nr:hypothetical protein [Bdellovibrio sp. 22V]WII73907.1 hypothetical protein QJS83_08465 [Bdellovibrio sp. 22V]